MSEHVAAIILIGVSTAAFFLILIVETLGKKWSNLQHFVSNKVGGLMAICSIFDFRSARSATKEGDFVVVPDTIILGVSKKIDPLKRMFLSGRAETLEYHASPWEFREEKRLFVPFLSDRIMDSEEQAMFFTLFKSLDGFLKRKRRENMMRDIRFIFAAVYHSNFDFGWWRGQAIRILIAGSALFVAKSFLK